MLLKNVVAKRVATDPQELSCYSTFENNVFVRAAVSVHMHGHADVERLLALVHHSVLNPVGAVTVECTCQDSAESSGESQLES